MLFLYWQEKKSKAQKEGIIWMEPVTTSKLLNSPHIHVYSHIKGNSVLSEGLLDQHALCMLGLGRTLGKRSE